MPCGGVLICLEDCRIHRPAKEWISVCSRGRMCHQVALFESLQPAEGARDSVTVPEV